MGILMTPDEIQNKYPRKFPPENSIFKSIHRSDRVYLESGCGEPQYLLSALTRYVESNPLNVVEAVQSARSCAVCA
ncbi:MAG: hypothetical protein JXA49_08805 [Actinobacteria bacterium]|nr:hypothetical protein [Actinomycetota bacterium]